MEMSELFSHSHNQIEVMETVKLISAKLDELELCHELIIQSLLHVITMNLESMLTDKSICRPLNLTFEGDEL